MSFARKAQRPKNSEGRFGVGSGFLVGVLLALLLVTLLLSRKVTHAQRALSNSEARELVTRSKFAGNACKALFLSMEAQSWTTAPLPEARIAWRDAVDFLSRQPGTMLARPLTIAQDPTWFEGHVVESVVNHNGTLRVEDAQTRKILIPTISALNFAKYRPSWNKDQEIYFSDSAAVEVRDPRYDTEYNFGLSDLDVDTFSLNPKGDLLAVSTRDGIFRVI